jgi:hypothetical protein
MLGGPDEAPSKSTRAVAMKPSNLRRLAGATKMLGKLLVGAGVVVSGYSLGPVACFFRSTCTNAGAVEATFVSTLELGIVIAGVGIMLFGIGVFLDSMHPDS